MPIASVAPAIEFIVDDILPAREVHIIGGPSGSGKSSLVFQLLIEQIRQGLPVFGHPSISIPMCYVSCDRSDASIKRTLKRLNIPNPIPILNARSITTSMETVIQRSRDLVPGCKLIFIEAIIRFVPEGKMNDYKIVSDYLTYLGLLCEKYDVTLVAITHAPKTHENEHYANPRQRLSGSVAWGAFTETVILIEPDGEEDGRLISVLPRNGEEMTYTYAFEKGILKEVSPEGTTFDLLDKHALPALKPDTLYPRLEILELVGQFHIKCSEKTVQRWLNDKVRIGRMEKITRGVYKLIPLQ